MNLHKANNPSYRDLFPCVPEKALAYKRMSPAVRLVPLPAANQAEFLEARFSITKVDASEMLRQSSNKQTEVGTCLA